MNKTKNYFLLILAILFVNLIEINTMNFSFKVAPYKTNCVGEYLTEDTVAIFSMSSNKDNIKVTLTDPKGKEIYTKNNQMDVRVSLTAVESGNHEMCIKNYENIEINIFFEFLSGIHAQDASEIAKESSIEPAENAIVKLKDISESLINDLNLVVKEEDKNLKTNDAISSKITYISILTLIVMILVGVIETVYIQKYLQNRKLI